MREHLTPLDATFLELEDADESAHMHIGAIMVFDPRPDGGTRRQIVGRGSQSRYSGVRFSLRARTASSKFWVVRRT